MTNRTGFSEYITIDEERKKTNPPVLNTSTLKSTQGHFQKGGVAYAQYRPTYPPELAQALAAECSSRQLAIDVGCGSGQLSSLLANHFDQVIATDVSEDQLAHAIACPNILYRCETAESIRIDDCSADLIVAAQAAHWFDLSRFYSEVRRVAKPGGVIALISYGVPHLEARVNAKFQQFYWHKISPFWPAERQHVETGYTQFPFPFESFQLPEFFIYRDWNIRNLMDYVKTWSSIRYAIADGQSEILAQFDEEISVLWGEPETLRRITWPISMRLGRIGKQYS